MEKIRWYDRRFWLSYLLLFAMVQASVLVIWAAVEGYWLGMFVGLAAQVGVHVYIQSMPEPD